MTSSAAISVVPATAQSAIADRSGRSADADAAEASACDGWPDVSADGLAALRAELDGIDDALHDLLIRRAEVVARLVASGSKLRHGIALRPGREAAIVRRLLARHAGPMPPHSVARVWRELLAASTAMQGPLVVAVCEIDPATGFTQAAREHFGALTPLHVHSTPGQAMADVTTGRSSVAVLPYPDAGTPAAAWWPKLLHNDPARLHVIARLPFWQPRSEGAPTVQALVVAALAPDPSGQDRSLLGIVHGPEVSRDRLIAALTAAGLTPLTTVLHREPSGGAVQALVEVDGFVTEGDPRFVALVAAGLRQPRVLGAYAVPMGAPAGNIAGSIG